MRTWALRELQGYPGALPEELPAYRRVSAPLLVDARSMTWQVTGERISPRQLPDVCRDVVSEEVPFHQGVGEIESLITNRGSGDAAVRISPPRGAEIALLLSHDRPGVNVTAIYWFVSCASLNGLLDQVRTRLTQLVAELRATMPQDQQNPTPAQVEQALHAVHITAGDNSPVNVTAPHTSAHQGSTVAVNTSPANEPSWWTLARKVWVGILGVATILGTIFAYIQVR